MHRRQAAICLIFVTCLLAPGSNLLTAQVPTKQSALQTYFNSVAVVDNNNATTTGALSRDNVFTVSIIREAHDHSKGSRVPPTWAYKARVSAESWFWLFERNYFDGSYSC
jgi:hypothetical protein